LTLTIAAGTVRREPEILEAAGDFLVVYKPPGLHSAPLGGGPSLFEWCAGRFPELRSLPGRREGEGGLLHRLDYETRGLLLVARTRTGFENLQAQQKGGAFVKEYRALSGGAGEGLPGFPPPPFSPSPGASFYVESFFRPYGPGRRAVRPAEPEKAGKAEGSETGAGKRRKKTASDRGRPYRTGVTEFTGTGGLFRFTLRIHRGFRHQIRCHLAWLGYPLLNDGLYGGLPLGDGILALEACGITFRDPQSGEPRRYTLAAAP
jgi:23S rRNA pseudouridine1911/1915/1917 synthase